jgi:hypothetical protein
MPLTRSFKDLVQKRVAADPDFAAALLREAIAELKRETAARFDEKLAADPEQAVDPGLLLFTIANELGFEIDLAQVPDEFLAWAVQTANPNEPETRATSQEGGGSAP